MTSTFVRVHQHFRGYGHNDARQEGKTRENHILNVEEETLRKVEENTKVSTKKCARELGSCAAYVRKLLEDEVFHPYHYQFCKKYFVH